MVSWKASMTHELSALLSAPCAMLHAFVNLEHWTSNFHVGLWTSNIELIGSQIRKPISLLAHRRFSPMWLRGRSCVCRFAEQAMKTRLLQEGKTRPVDDSVHIWNIHATAIGIDYGSENILDANSQLGWRNFPQNLNSKKDWGWHRRLRDYSLEKAEKLKSWKLTGQHKSRKQKVE